jgi:hypothetical protein
MRKIIPLFIAICSSYEALAQYIYPPAKTVDSSDTYFGVTYKDPYRMPFSMHDCTSSSIHFTVNYSKYI